MAVHHFVVGGTYDERKRPLGILMCPLIKGRCSLKTGRTVLLVYLIHPDDTTVHIKYNHQIDLVKINPYDCI